MNPLRGQVRYADVRGYFGHYANSNRRRIREDVARHLRFPAELRAVTSRTVWGVSMVRDEADIIESVIRHQIGQGIAPILIADNNSSDDTPAILARLSRELPIYLVRDSLDAYQQAEKMTALSRAAFARGATWVVPFDADEMWFAEDQTVGQFLAASTDSIVHAAMFNVYPGATGELCELDLAEQPQGKVAFRASRFALVGIGNHTVLRSGTAGQGLYLAHFPWRSPVQLMRKVRQGRRALERAMLPVNMGSHWRSLADLSDGDVQELWSSIEVHRPHPALRDTFVGPFQSVQPSNWKTWLGPTRGKHKVGDRDD